VKRAGICKKERYYHWYQLYTDRETYVA